MQNQGQTPLFHGSPATSTSINAEVATSSKDTQVATDSPLDVIKKEADKLFRAFSQISRPAITQMHQDLYTQRDQVDEGKLQLLAAKTNFLDEMEEFLEQYDATLQHLEHDGVDANRSAMEEALRAKLALLKAAGVQFQYNEAAVKASETKVSQSMEGLLGLEASLETLRAQAVNIEAMCKSILPDHLLNDEASGNTS